MSFDGVLAALAPSDGPAPSAVCGLTMSSKRVATCSTSSGVSAPSHYEMLLTSPRLSSLVYVRQYSVPEVNLRKHSRPAQKQQAPQMTMDHPGSQMPNGSGTKRLRSAARLVRGTFANTGILRSHSLKSAMR